MNTGDLSASWQTTTAEETFALGESLGRCFIGGLTIGLVGPLGAGKTQFVKGLAAGNDLDEPTRVTSPTFTLMHEYPGRLRLRHVDVYRLEGVEELTALGFDEWIDADAVVVVEWADRAGPVIPPDALWIELRITGDSSRLIEFRAARGVGVTCLKGLVSMRR